MNGILANAGGILRPDGARSSLTGVGRPDQRPEIFNGIILLEDGRDDRTAGHELDQFTVERPFFVNGVESTRLFGRELGVLHGYDLEAGFIDLGQDGADVSVPNGIRLDHSECAITRHAWSFFCFLNCGAKVGNPVQERQAEMPFCRLLKKGEFRRRMDSNALLDFLRVPRDIVLVSHRNPDGDAVGSILAMGDVLRQRGHSVHLLLPSEYPAIYNWMPGVDSIQIYDQQQQVCLEYIQQAESVWMLDFNAYDRIDRMGEEVHHREDDLVKVVIDHHIEPEPIYDFLWHDTAASSTCELVFDLIRELSWESHVSTEVAHALMTGILTDTGSFKYNTRPILFHKVADILAQGVDLNDLQIRLFNQLPEKQLRLLGYCLHERMELLDEYHTGIITLSKEDYARFDIQRGDTEGIVNYLLQIHKIRFAVFITEQPTIIKLSFRSTGSFSVQEFARDHFNGGGHRNAAGGAVYGTLSKTVKKVKSLLPQYATQLTTE